MKNRLSSHCSGYALLTVMLTVAILAFLLGMAANFSTNSLSLSKRSAINLDITQVADAGVNHIYGHLTTILGLPNTLPTNINMQLLSQTFNVSNVPPHIYDPKRHKILNYTVIPLTTNGVPAQQPDNAVVDGKQYRFLAVVWVQSLMDPSAITKVQQEMQFTFSPLFQYAIFYQPDLEIAHGPDMVFGGKVHSNGKILQFNSNDQGRSIYNGAVTSVNGYFTNNPAGYKYSVSLAVDPSKKKFSFNAGPASITSLKSLPGVMNNTNTTSNPNMNTNGAIELIQRPILGNHGGTNFTMDRTDSTYGDPYAPIAGIPADDVDQTETRMFYKADLRIITDNSGVVKFYSGDVSVSNPNGIEIPMLLSNYVVDSGTGATNLIVLTNQTYLALTNAVVPNKKFSDFRWANTKTNNPGANGVTNVTTMEIDVSKLVDTNGNLLSNLSSHLTVTSAGNTLTNTTPMNLADFNGIIYASNTSGSDTNKTGVVLKNAHKLPNNVISDGVTQKTGVGLSVITDNPLYIVGNFNTGTTNPATSQLSGANAVSNSATWNLTNSTAAGYNRLPASVMADMVTIVTQDYLNYQTKTTRSERRPSKGVTVNAAIVTGITPSTIDPSGSGTNEWMSGGSGNVIGLLEDFWVDNGKNRKVVINGSLAALYKSEQMTAPWYCNLSTGSGASKTSLLPGNVNANDFTTYYDAPLRVWSFDPMYLDPTKLPPGTPMVREFNLGQWAKVQ